MDRGFSLLIKLQRTFQDRFLEMFGAMVPILAEETIMSG